jgi:hypothetical protein
MGLFARALDARSASRARVNAASSSSSMTPAREMAHVKKRARRVLGSAADDVAVHAETHRAPAAGAGHEASTATMVR